MSRKIFDVPQALVLVAWCLAGVVVGRVAAAQSQASTRLAWDQSPADGHAIGYQVTVDGTQVVDAGPALTVTVPLEPGPHTAVVQSYWSDATPRPYSPSVPVPPLSFTVVGQVKPDPCLTSPATIVVSGYSAALKVDADLEGTVLAKVAGPSPVVQIQILLGEQVVGQIDGAELRSVRSVGFGFPRTPGTYHLFVAAKDARGCAPKTTLDRPLVIS